MRGIATGRAALVVFGVALAVRVLFLAFTPAPELIGDARDYEARALRLLEGKGYVNSRGEATSRRPPGYPMFLAAVYWTVGRNVGAVGLAQAVLDAATSLIIYILARQMFDATVALMAAGLTTLSLGQIAATRLLLSELLATFLLVLTVLLLHAGLARPSRIALGGAGVTLGLGALTKGEIVLLPFLLGWVIWRASERDTTAALKRWSVVLLCFSLTLLPWVVRNYDVHHRFVPVSTEIGQAMYSSYNPPRGKIFGFDTDDETTRRIRSTLPEAEQSRAFLAETVRYISEHPHALPKLTLLKVVYFISPIDWELIPGGGVVNFTFAFATPFALYGLWLVRGKGWQAGLLTTMLAGFVITAVLTYGSPRLRLPVEPLLWIFSGLGLFETVRRFSSRRLLVLGGISAYFAATFASFVFSGRVRAAAAFLLGGLGLW